MQINSELQKCAAAIKGWTVKFLVSGKKWLDCQSIAVWLEGCSTSWVHELRKIMTRSSSSRATEGTKAKVNASWCQKEIVLAGVVKRTDRLVEVDKWTKGLRKVGRWLWMLLWPTCTVFWCGLVTNEVVGGEAQSGRGYQTNSGESVLNPLKFICVIVRCNEDNRIGIVKTEADESMGNKWGSGIIKTVPDVSKGLRVIIAWLRDLVNDLTCLWTVRFV